LWAKKIRQKVYYFGVWEDADAALRKFLRERDDLFAGRKPREQTADGVDVAELASRFLTSRMNRLESGELVQRTFDDYKRTTDRIVETFGRSRRVSDLTPDDFAELRKAIAKRWGATALGNEIQRVRVVFKWADDAGLIERPVRYGPDFRRPSRKVLRVERAKKGPRMFEAHEIRALVDGALVVGDDGPELVQGNAALRAMFLLGVNAGYGNTDVGRLRFEHVQGEWATFPRPKTGVARRAWLWPETRAALAAAVAERPTPADEASADLVFVTRWGGSWAKEGMDNPVSKETAKLIKALGLERRGRSFYALRHVFETIAGEAKDQVVVDYVMGHLDQSMAATYRERISDDRVRAVCDHVRRWLFPEAVAAPGE
jgi:integrase